MSISTLEGLEALAVDAPVTVRSNQGSQVFVRTPDGLRSPEGFVMPISVFEGAAVNGRIAGPTTGETPTPTPEVDVRQIRGQALTEMRDYMVSVFDGDNFDRGEINSIFTHFRLMHLPEPDEDVEVSISVRGTTCLSASDIEGVIGHAVDADSTEVNWTAQFDRTFTVEEGTCACDEVSNATITDWLSGESIPYSDFDYEAECENC